MKAQTGRPKGLRKLPPLHAATLARVEGRFLVELNEADGAESATVPPPSKRQKMKAAALSTVAIEPRILELCLRISQTRGIESLRELHSEETARLARAAQTAASVGDAPFFQHVAEGMTLVTDGKLKPNRLAYIEAWISASKISNPPTMAQIREGMKCRVGDITDAEISNYKRATGLSYVSRHSFKK